MLSDCAITGGGPAGLNANLILGRDHNKVPSFCLLFDNQFWI
jgi:thioredoxin reductase